MLPGYIAINDVTIDDAQKQVLITPAKEYVFPLKETDLQEIKTIETIFDNEENMAGLAAPQVGIHKKVIVFSAPDDPELKKWRPDLEDTMDKTIWLNASYTPTGTKTSTDYEGCFSVNDMVAPVTRPYSIDYVAYDLEGNKITGAAKGFLARVIQHEIDHTNGILFIDRANKEDIISKEKYMEMRKKAVETGKRD